MSTETIIKPDDRPGIPQRPLTRRNVLSGITLGSAAGLLAACTSSTSTVNGVTTTTYVLNVAQADAWFNALDSGVTMVLGLTGVATSPTGLAIAAVGQVMSTDLAAFNTATKGQVELQFTSSSVPAAVAALETDATTLLADVSKATTGVVAADAANATNYLNAIKAVVSLFQATIGSVSTAAAASASPMTEAQAISILSKK